MARETITDLIDGAMRAARTDAAKIERATGVPAGWTRQLKAGRVGGGADPDRVKLVAAALGLDEARLWALLGRMDLVAAVRGDVSLAGSDGTPHVTPELAALIAAQTEAIREQTAAFTALAGSIDRAAGNVTGAVGGFGEVLALVAARLGVELEQSADGPPPQRPAPSGGR